MQRSVLILIVLISSLFWIKSKILPESVGVNNLRLSNQVNTVNFQLEINELINLYEMNVRQLKAFVENRMNNQWMFMTIKIINSRKQYLKINRFSRLGTTTDSWNWQYLIKVGTKPSNFPTSCQFNSTQKFLKVSLPLKFKHRYTSSVLNKWTDVEIRLNFHVLWANCSKGGLKKNRLNLFHLESWAYLLD